MSYPFQSIQEGIKKERQKHKNKIKAEILPKNCASGRL
jgi:hypothetical protein